MTKQALALTLIAAAVLTACGGGDSSSSSANIPPGCTETGVAPQFACQTGSTEPLYRYQWALKQATSFFAAFGLVADGSTDINVESVHAAGIKGQGVNVLVLDDGIDVRHEDLAANVDRSMTYNFDDGSNDPTPANIATNVNEAHGTHVAGIIAAAQNGKGVMGIAPRAILGGARYLGSANADVVAAYGGASWSENADIINASYGENPTTPLAYDTGTSEQTAAMRAFPNLRQGRGLVMLKATGNEYVGHGDRTCPIVGETGMIGCETPANDPETLEPTAVVVTAANAKGVKASYSNAGPVNWVTGLGGEYGEGERYGEVGTGPNIYSTDLSGCGRGYSRNDLPYPTNDFTTANTPTNLKENPGCNYSSLNGTSAATPTVSGVVALMLSANPNLTWRDVREILRATARKIDPDYGNRESRSARIDLITRDATADTSTALTDGSSTARLDYGWQTNGAGYSYSTWYGFGLVDAVAAVKMAKATTFHKPAPLTVPSFTTAFADVDELDYGSVQKLGQFNVNGSGKVDEFQLRVSGSVCIGSVGFFVKSPSGTISTLSLPYNIYYKTGIGNVSNYGLGSYAFYDENAAGTWEVYAVSGVPNTNCAAYKPQDDSQTTQLTQPLNIQYRIIAAQ
jgi:subtilisin family serine protease